MSLKAVEMQISIPRTQEIARIQEQQQHRNMHERQALIENQKQLDDRNRKQPIQISESDSAQIKSRQEERHSKKRETPNQHHTPEKKSEQAEVKRSVDPIRGKVIDISC